MGPAVIRKPKTGMRALTAQSPGPGQLMNTVAHANVSGSDEAVMQRVAWKILPFLMLLYFVAFVDRLYDAQVAVLSGTAPSGVTLEDLGGAVRIRIGDPSRTITGRLGAISSAWMVASS